MSYRKLPERRCQARNAHGSQCRNEATTYVPLDAQSEALMCPEHQRLAREGRVQVVGRQRSDAEMYREALLRNPKTPVSVREYIQACSDAEIMEFAGTAKRVGNLSAEQREELRERLEQEGV